MKYPKRGLSIDIGNEKIKIIEYSRKKEKIVIKKALLLDTPEACISDGMLTDIGQLAEVIQVGLKEKKMKSKKVIFTLSSSKIITREVDLPSLPTKKLATLIQMNAEEYFPVNLIEYTLDYRIVERLEGELDTPIRVNIFAALTVLLDGYINLAETLGLKIGGLDYSGNSIINYASKMDDEHTFMVLDLGMENTMVTIMHQGVAKFNRSLVYGTKVINKNIQTHFGLSYKEAVKISTEQMLLSSNPEGNDILSTDVSNGLNQVLNGVARLVDYYSSRNKESIKHIYLVGGGTNIQGIADYIEQYFNIPTRRVDNLGKVHSKYATYVEHPEFYASVVGAICSKVNLLPKSILDKGKTSAASRLKMELIIFLLLMGGVLIYMPYTALKDLRAERDLLVQEIETKKVVLPVVARHKQKMDELNFNQTVLQLSGSSTEAVLAILEKMEASIPTSVDYMAMSNSEEGILISCVAKDKLTVVTFIQVLKAMTLEDEQLFSNVYVPAISEVTNEVEGDTYYSFSIAATYAKEVE